MNLPEKCPRCGVDRSGVDGSRVPFKCGAEWRDGKMTIPCEPQPSAQTPWGQGIIPLHEQMIELIRQELERARAKFPNRAHMLAAFSEEAGELAKAMIDHEYIAGEPAVAVLREAIQAAAMAIRVATEGDSTFRYQPERAFSEMAGRGIK